MNKGRSGQSLDEAIGPGLDAMFDEVFAGASAETLAALGYSG